MSKPTEKQETEGQEDLSSKKGNDTSQTPPKKDDMEEVKKDVTRILRNRLPKKRSDFRKAEDKDWSRRDEFVTMQHFYKSEKSFPESISKRERNEHNQDRQDAVRHLVGSTMYHLLVDGYPPKEVLVTPDEQNLDSLYASSKSKETTLRTFTKNSGIKSVKALEGFEQVNAACDLLRAIDYDGNSLSVRNGTTVVKTNHSGSFIAEFTDFSSMVQEKQEAFVRSGHIYRFDLFFNVEEYSQALNQMLERYNEQQMEAVIDQRFDELKKVGFDPDGIVVYPVGKSGKRVDSFDELKLFYKEQIRNNVTIMRDVAKSTEIISKFSNVSNEFKNGGWLEAFAYSRIQDPVSYAAHHNIQIEGRNALEWAYNNNYKVRSPRPTEKTTTETQWKKGSGGKWKEEESVVTRESIETISWDPIEYITYNRKRLGVKLSRSEKEFLAQADVFNYADSSKQKVKDKRLHDFAPNSKDIAGVHSKDQDTANSLVTLVDDFVVEVAKNTLTTKEVIEFQDKLLSHLEKQGYLTKQDTAKIKQDPDYTKQAEKTAELLNTNTEKLDLKTTEKLYYKVARFAEAIGLAPISNYFMKKIPSKKLEQITTIETALAHSIEVITISDKSKQMLHTARLKEMKEQTQGKLKSRGGRP
jgi:hypothetical protein